jgi:hypothetical protein
MDLALGHALETSPPRRHLIFPYADLRGLEESVKNEIHGTQKRPRDVHLEDAIYLGSALCSVSYKASR